ncbi:hypothetical protein, partial [Microbacterium sp.]|uniref:hypothetical protein n=1 Tax=Microbacterium sp. TaxID=51671 RepID=UPI003C707CE7
MTTAALLLLDLVAAVAATAAWAGAAAMTWPSAASGEPPHARAGRSRWALILTAVAIVAAAAHIVIVLALWGRGWWFAQDQVVLGMPVLAVVTAVTAAVAIPPLVRFLRGVRGDARDVPVRVPLWFVIAASAGGVCVVSRLVVGYPMDPLAVAALLVLMLLAVGLSRALLLGAPRRTIVGFAGLGVIAAIAWTGVAWATSL